MEKNNDGLKSKDKIMEAAESLFLEKGYSKTTTREIAKESGENLGLIVYYFKTKDNLARIIYQNLLDQLYVDLDMDGFQYDNAIEELFMSLTIAQKMMMEKEQLLKFFWDMMLNDIVPTDAHKYTMNLLNKVISENDLEISDQEVYKYSVAAKGVEKVMTQKKLKGKLDITYMEINKIILSTSLMHLGIPKSTIDETIDDCIERLDEETKGILCQ